MRKKAGSDSNLTIEKRLDELEQAFVLWVCNGPHVKQDGSKHMADMTTRAQDLILRIAGRVANNS